MLEALENRNLLSGVHGGGTGGGNTFDPNQFGPAVVVQSADKSVLTIDNAHDLRIIEMAPGDIDVYDYSVGGTNVTPTTYSGVKTVTINGTSGGDILSSGIDYANLTINGGGGVDQITVSDNVATASGGGSTVVHGGNGNDRFVVGNSNAGTKVFGEGGHDRYTGPAGVFAQ